MDNKIVVYLYNEIWLGNKNEWTPYTCNNTDDSLTIKWSKWIQTPETPHFLILLIWYSKKAKLGGSPGGSVVKNPPVNAGDMGWIPGLGRSHMPWGNYSWHHSYWDDALEPGSHKHWGCVLQPLKPRYHRDCALQQEKALQGKGHANTQCNWRVAPALHNQRKTVCSSEDPAQPKINKNFKKANL